MLPRLRLCNGVIPSCTIKAKFVLQEVGRFLPAWPATGAMP